MDHHRITIKDIAAAAGISARAVSAALNDTGRVSTHTRNRVIAIAKDMNYRPNVSARGLVQNRSYLVGAVFPYADVSFFNEIISGVEERCSAREHDMLLGNAALLGASDERRALQRMIDRGVDGIVCAPDYAEKQLFSTLVHDGPPIVQVMTRLSGVEIPFIGVDNEYGGALATRHLLEQGHRHIGFLSAQRRNYVEVMDRRRGYHVALEEFGIQPDESRYEVVGDLTSKGGEAATAALLRHSPEITAVFAPTDYAALGAIRAALAAGRAVPEDLSVIGYDDIEVAAAQIVYPLTTIAQPKREIGSQAFDMLEDRMKGKDVASRLLRPSLVVRSTTGRI